MIEVAVAVIQRGDGRLLMTRRQAGQDFAHHWEFPGGKQEAQETPRQALVRELQEEVDITPTEVEPLITIPWQYAHKAVRLTVWRVTDWQGAPQAREGQAMAWLTLAEVMALPLPPANRGILQALCLPDRYAITGSFADEADLLAGIDRLLTGGHRLIQLRARLDADAYVRVARQALQRIQAAGGQLLLNAPLELWLQVPGAGWHADSRRLWSLCERPVPASVLMSASVHDGEQLAQAQLLGADVLLLSPVLPTPSHPGEPALGWDAAAALVAEAVVPVYALGGMTADQRVQARQAGFQGVSAISAFWQP